MKYPSHDFTVSALIDVARRAGMEVNADHPEDIAIAMINAIEHGGSMLSILNESGNLKE